MPRSCLKKTPHAAGGSRLIFESQPAPTPINLGRKSAWLLGDQRDGLELGAKRIGVETLFTKEVEAAGVASLEDVLRQGPRK